MFDALPAHCRLYDANWFQPKYHDKPSPPEPKSQRRAPSAGIDRPPAQAEAAAAAASAKPPREPSHAPKTLKEGPVRVSSTSRSAKDNVGRESLRDNREANGKESKEGAIRDGRDRGREASTRGGKEHGDKPSSSAREGRDSNRAVGKAAADDQQLADVRAAALKAAENGTNGDAGKRRSPARRDELVNGTKAAAVNGTAAVPGTKRRAPDSGATEAR